MASAVYHNFMQMMGYAGTAPERIRDTSITSKNGFSTDLNQILTDIYKDDVLQPKQSSKLRL
jgi:hypothetical protein